jgi:hypothetical protein
MRRANILSRFLTLSLLFAALVITSSSPASAQTRPRTVSNAKTQAAAPNAPRQDITRPRRAEAPQTAEQVKSAKDRSADPLKEADGFLKRLNRLIDSYLQTSRRAREL